MEEDNYNTSKRNTKGFASGVSGAGSSEVISGYDDTRFIPDEQRDTIPKELLENREKEYKAIVHAIIASYKGRTFFDQYNNAYAIVCGKECIHIETDEFKRHLRREFFQKYEEPLQNVFLDQIIDTLVATTPKARVRHLSKRISFKKREGTLLYHLGNPNHQVIKVTKDGWEIIDINQDNQDNLAIFQNLETSQEQVKPIRELEAGRRYLKDWVESFSINDESQRIIAEVDTILAFFNDIDHPLLSLHGPENTGKSTFAAQRKQLVDPRVSPDDSASKRNKLGALTRTDFTKQWDFAVVLNGDYITNFDNVTSLPSEIQDELCAICTGYYASRRKLYKDTDKVTLSGNSQVTITSINNSITKPDALSRTMLLKFENRDSENQVGENELWEKFEESKPYTLGYMFNILSKFLAKYDELASQIKPSQRFPDYEIYGEIVARCFGYQEGTFQKALAVNTDTQKNTAINNSTLAQVLLKYMEELPLQHPDIDKIAVEYEPAELLKVLKDYAIQQNMYNSQDSTFPKDPSWLTKNLNKLKESLRYNGVAVETGKKSNKGRNVITLRTAS